MPFVSKTLQYSFCACVRNILKIVIMVVIEKMKLVSFSLFLDAPPLDPRCPLDNWTSLYIYMYTTCVKGVLGLGGKRSCISEKRHQSSDKNRPLCKMVVFIVHQLCKYNIIYSFVINVGRSFTLVKRSISHTCYWIASTVDDQNKF